MALWPDDVFVDFDRGITSAINRWREALGDSAENPVFVETVGRRGYRWIVPTYIPPEPGAPQEPLPVAAVPPDAIVEVVPGAKVGEKWPYVIGVAGGRAFDLSAASSTKGWPVLRFLKGGSRHA